MGRWDLTDYLDLDRGEARAQWRRILARRPWQRGVRQEVFLPVEVVLAYALFDHLDPHGYGGGNLASLPEEAHLLSTLFRRSPGSITQKMLNLDGARSNCGAHEPELFRRWTADRDTFDAVRYRVLEAAAEVLPEDHVRQKLLAWLRPAPLLAQERIDTGSEAFARALAEELAGVRFGVPGAAETERLAEMRLRVGQTRFARQVLARYAFRCGFCGFQPVDLDGSGMLIASHIKPWAHCENNGERRDPRNGIAACPVHDRAFDAGLMGVNGGLRIHRTRGLLANVRADRVGEAFFGDRTLSRRLLVPEGGEGPAPEYLAFHLERVFRRT